MLVGVVVVCYPNRTITECVVCTSSSCCRLLGGHKIHNYIKLRDGSMNSIAL